MNPPTSGPTTTLTMDMMAAGDLSIGYALSDWIAVGAVGAFGTGSVTVESGDTSKKIRQSYVASMLGGRLYPFETLGMNLGLAGGWSWMMLDLEAVPSTFHGPFWTASLGWDGRIFVGRNWAGKQVEEPFSSQLYTVDLRFHHASLNSGDWEGSAWGLAVLLGGSL